MKKANQFNFFPINASRRGLWADIDYRQIDYVCAPRVNLVFVIGTWGYSVGSRLRALHYLLIYILFQPLTFHSWGFGFRGL